MSILVKIFLLWLFWRLLKWLTRPWWREQQRRTEIGRIRHYRLTPERNHWLALAHPMAFNQLHGGMADLEHFPLDEVMRKRVGTITLHHFKLSAQLTDEQARAAMPDKVRQLWFRQDLQNLLPQDNARDAMAFACCRTAFFVRMAHWLGWIDAPLQWEVLRLNAARAQACFHSWEDYGSACLRGRQQWIQAGRSDTLGKAHTPEELQEWLGASWHPWGAWDWFHAPHGTNEAGLPAEPAPSQAATS